MNNSEKEWNCRQSCIADFYSIIIQFFVCNFMNSVKKCVLKFKVETNISDPLENIHNHQV